MRPTLVACVLSVLTFVALPASGQALPPGFQDSVVLSGLTLPMAVRFAPDGRIFVAEKSGLIKVFDSLQDPTPTVFADLRVEVMDYWDRGLLGLAIDPNFPSQPYVYVSYTYDFDPATPQIPPPRWGDQCPTPPGPNDDGCVVTGRVSRLKINPDDTQNGPEQVLLGNNWCQQFPSHSLGAIDFGPEGALYVSAGEGASFRLVDYGQKGGTLGAPPPVPSNPCGDPPTGRGGTQTAPSGEGGALRSQDYRTTSDSLSWDGSMLRVDPVTGVGWPGNPNSDRTVAFGFRNPFRWTFRPGTAEVWLGDVGWDTWEEINRLTAIPGPSAANFGWPCYEGAPRQPSYENAGLTLCQTLYGQGPSAVLAPYFAYQHYQKIDPNETCSNANSSITGLVFYPAGGYPSSYEDALFFADHSRNCMWVMTKGANGLPDPATVHVFENGASEPVDLQRGPGGDVFYVDHEGGAIHRISYTSGNTPPTAVADASPRSGGVPLTVQFDGSLSSDPDPGATLTYAWDLDGDGLFNDAFVVRPIHTYTVAGQITARLRVTDDKGASSIDGVVVSPGNHAPLATVTAPPPTLTWAVGDAIVYSGKGQDTEDGAMPASSMHWDIVMHHCPSGTPDCHEHLIESHDGTSGGTFVAPDHDYYSYLEFRLTVTDLGGLTGVNSADIDPKTSVTTFASSPAGATISVGFRTAPAPFSQTLIVNSTNSVSAAGLQTLAGLPSYWSSWSDGGARLHDIVAGASAATLTASYLVCGTVEICGDGRDNDCDGVVDNGAIPGPMLSFHVDHDKMFWTALPGAQTYDVVRGSLNGLRNSHGDFAAYTQECLDNNDPGTALIYPSNPPASGSVQWYMVRANNCAGAGTWNDGSPTQVADRDPGINASSHTCP
jgi:glucose/arabinose dehydrogenase